jgi:xylulokinase
MYLGIDAGTSSVKALLIDSGQKVVGTASSPLEVSRPQPGWSEQAPADWWTATNAAVAALKAAHPKEVAAVEGIGLSGHMHGATLLGKDDQVLRPCILWNDGRSGAECAEIERACPNSRKIAGNIAMAGFTAPKLLWVKKHEPKVFAQVAKVLLPKDYIRLLMTGDHASDMSDSAGTLWMDVAKRDWSDELLAATSLTRAQMPELFEGSAPTGRLSAAVAAAWGMPKLPIVAGGGGDNAASACGIGAVKPGAGFLSLGTSGVLFVSNAKFSPNTAGAVHAFCHAIPNTWHQMGVILSATGSLEWLSGLLGEPVPKLMSALGPDIGAPSPVTFLPYLSGERTPHNDPSARGVFAGLGQESDRAALTHAVIEGVAFAVRDCQEVLKAAGTRIESLMAVGGGSRSKLWLRIIATLLDTPLLLPEHAEAGAALGAARLGLAAATGGDPVAICAAPPVAEVIEPSQAHRAAYEAAYRRYRKLYPAIKEALQA